MKTCHLLVIFLIVLLLPPGNPEATSLETTSPETTSPETTSPETTSPETTSPETTSPEATTSPSGPKPAGQVSLALVTTVKGTSQTLETALAEVPANITDKVLEAFLPGASPPSFITHKTVKVTSEELGTGTPVITHSITVGATAPPGTYNYTVEYSFFAQPIEFFVAAEAIRINVFVLEHPLSLGTTTVDFGNTLGGDRKTVQIRNLIERSLHLALTSPAGITLDADDVTFSLGPGESHVVDLTISAGASGLLDGLIEIHTTDDVDPPEVDGIQTISVIGTVGDGGEVTPLVGDFDGNRIVDFADFLLFAAAFGGSDPDFDLTGDGRVDFSDFLEFAQQFGKRA
jgi:hypothetical protein